MSDHRLTVGNRSCSPGARLLAIVATWLAAGNSAGAAPTSPRLQMTANVVVVAPRGNFARHAPGTASGVGLQALYTSPKTPFSLGLGAYVMGISSRSFDEGSGILYLDGEWIVGPTRTHQSTDMRMLDLVVRIEPPWTRLRPFAEVTVGTAQYFTVWERESVLTADTFAMDERADDLTWSTGFGVGVNIEPWRRKQVVGDALGAWVFTIGARWMRGGQISYVDPAVMDTTGGLTTAREGAFLEMVVPFVGFGVVLVGQRAD